MRAARAVIVGIAGLLASAEARAEDATGARTSSLSWLRMPNAESCISTQALARGIEERLGRRVFVSAAEADVSVEGRIEKQRDGSWHAVVTIRDAKGTPLGTRDVKSDSPKDPCDAMNAPLVLVLAVMIDPDATHPPASSPALAPAPTTTETPAPAPTPASPPPVAAAPPAAPAKPLDERWQVEAGGAVTLADGMTPSAAFGGGVEGMVYAPKIPIGLRGYGNVFLPSTLSKDGAVVSYDLLYVGGGLCPTLRGVVHVMGCVGGHLGALRPRVETKDRSISEDVMPVWNVVVEARIRVPIAGPLAAFGGAGVGLPLLRPTSEQTTPTGEKATLHAYGSAVFTGTLGLGFVAP